MNPDECDFDTLKAGSFGASATWLTTFAYWLGVLADPSSKFAREAEESCAVMSCQYDIEEQACELDELRGYREIIPSIFHPVAPVTLALRWSPFPAAFAALGQPVHINQGDVAKTLAVFRPVESPTFSAATPDERHFQFLLQHACERAVRTKRWILLTGSPGWSYDSEDFIAERPDLQQLMADFGFVAHARKPANAILSFLGCSKSKEAQSPAMKRFQHSSFWLLAPDSWARNPDPDLFSISAPHDAASVTATAYSKQDGSLDDFAAYRFSAVQPFYSQVGAETRNGSGPIERIIRHYEGTWPSESHPTYYVVACIHLPGVYVSLGITTTRHEFEHNAKLYESIIKSVTNGA